MNTTASNAPDVDLALDVAALLRRGTSATHATANNSEGATWLTRGELDKDEYIRFLILLWHIYSSLEAALEEHATHPVLMPTYNPTLLARAPALSSDIAHLLSVPESTWRLHPLAMSIAETPPTSLTTYTQRIQTLAASSDPSGLLAHAYVRYLGDLSGGQIIRRRISKAYGLDVDLGLGTQFYEFRKLGGGGIAGIGDMGRIKEWYREGMNQGVGDDERRKAALVEESNMAFKLNVDILSTLRPPSTSTSTYAPAIDRTNEVAKPNFSVAGVISFVLAVGIAHVALSGGFLESSGMKQWERALEWIARVFGVVSA